MMRMKKISLLILLMLLSVGFTAPAHAKTRNVMSRSERKAQKKQRKAQKKYTKAQRKAQRKMIKKDRKNTKMFKR
jgi:hypothetical protein